MERRKIPFVVSQKVVAAENKRLHSAPQFLAVTQSTIRLLF